MTFIDLLKNLGGKPPVSRDRVAIASSMETSSWNDRTGGLDGARRQEVVSAYRRIYRSGGLLRTGLDLYPQFMLTGGYTINSADALDTCKADIERILSARVSEFDESVYQAVLDAVCIGDGYCKLLYGAGTSADIPVGLQHLPAERVVIHIDSAYQILNYTVLDEMGRTIADIPPEEMLHIVLFPDGGNRYGIGLIESSWDDIKNDCMIAESTAVAIKRHGFGIWHAKVSSTDPTTPVRDADVVAVRNALQKISARSEIVTTGNVEITGLNESGMSNPVLYADWSVTRLCTALGVPGELLGLRQGTTDATAVERIANFYKKIQTLQDSLAKAVNTQFIDRILAAKGVPAGSVWLEYRDPSPDDDIKRVQYVAGISAMTPDDPFGIMSRKQIQTYLDIDPDEWSRDEEI